MLSIHHRGSSWGRRVVVSAALALAFVSLCASWSPARAAGPAPALSAGAQVTATSVPEPLPIAPVPTDIPSEPAPGEREIIRGDKLVTGGFYTLHSGQTLRGDLTLLGGEASLEEGSRVEGSVSVLGGSADVAGAIADDMNLVGGSVRLRSSARVDGDVNVMGGSLIEDPGAVVRGETHRFTGPRFALEYPEDADGYDWGWGGLFRRLVNFVVGALAALTGIILITLFSIAAVALFPNHVARTVAAISSQWLLSGVIGALTFFAVTILVVLLTLTLCLIPFAALLALACAVAILSGWAVVARIVGERVMIGLKQDQWTLIGQTAVGAVFLALLGLVPILGWLVGFAAASIGVGALILTRFGTRTYLSQGVPNATRDGMTLPVVEAAPPPDSGQPDNAQLPPAPPPAAPPPAA